MDRVQRARIVAGIAFAASIGFAIAREWGASLATLVMALAPLLLVTDRDVPATITGQGALASHRALAGLVRELRLTGRGVVTSSDALGSRLFLPARDGDDDIPDAAPDVVTIHRQGPHAIGLSLPHPGAGLEAHWRDAHGLPEGQGLEEAADHIRNALLTLQLGRDVSIARATDRVRVSYTPVAYALVCREAREQDWHTHLGCPACGLVAALLARATRTPVRLGAQAGAGDRVELDLELVKPAMVLANA